MDTIYEVEWLIDIGAGVLVLPPHTIWFPVFISILMECLLARLIKTKFWWLFNFQLSCRFNHNKQSRQHFIWKTLLSSKFVMNFCFNNHFYFQAQPEPGPPLLICPYPECLSPHPSPPPPLPPSPPPPNITTPAMVFHSEGRVKRTRLMLARAWRSLPKTSFPHRKQSF